MSPEVQAPQRPYRRSRRLGQNVAAEVSPVGAGSLPRHHQRRATAVLVEHDGDVMRARSQMDLTLLLNRTAGNTSCLSEACLKTKSRWE